MPKLIINKLGPVETCELECSQFMNFTGFQASGCLLYTSHEAEKKNNRGVLKPICKLKFKMQTAVREDLLRYLQSGKTMEEK